MLFNSLEFAIFLPIVFFLYWFLFDYALKQCKHQLLLQNLFVVIVSYIFYGWWDWRFLLLIAITSICSWGSGLLIEKSNKPKTWMVANIILNLSILGVFKYYDFFVSSFAHLFGANPDGLLLRIILPVGISFYTFQALSYSIDVYRKKLSATKNIVAFFAYVSFFPQLVAGPIERATNLLPQFQKKRTFDYILAVDGMRQILWGLFKKVVVADNCATYVDQMFGTYDQQTGATLLWAAILFTFQIYADFSGYSDIAIGTAKLFGIRLLRNFNVPYFSRSIAEFWRRWHISLNSWFVDYVYIPLGGSREGKMCHIRNIFVIFLLSGLWHGANWTYVCWGIYHALLFIPLVLLNLHKKYQNPISWKEIPQMVLTFVLVILGWIVFRTPSVADAGLYIYHMVTNLISIPYLDNTLVIGIGIGIMAIVEWVNRNREHELDLSWISNRYVPIVLEILLIIAMRYLGKYDYTEFIYFQF